MATTTTANPYALDPRVMANVADLPGLVGQARRLGELIRAGQLDPRTLTADTWGTLLDSLRQILRDQPTLDDWGPAIDRYVRPLLGSNAPASLQAKAANILTDISLRNGRPDPQLLTWLYPGGTTASLFPQQAQTLETLMRELGADKDVQGAYVGFMSRYAPSGRLTGAAFGPEGALRLAQLYQTAMDVLPADIYSSLPRLELPENPQGLPLAWQQATQAVAEWLLGSYGIVPTPTGFATSPELQVNRIFARVSPEFTAAAAEALLNALQRGDPIRQAAENPLSTTTLRAPAGPAAPTTQPATPADSLRQAAESLASGYAQQGATQRQGRLDRFLEQIRQALTGWRQLSEDQERVFQEAVRPVLDQMIQQAGSRRAAFDYFNSLSWQDQIRMFGGAAMANRVRQYLATGR